MKTDQKILRAKALKYKFNETYRRECISKSKMRHESNMMYEEFRELRKIRVNIYNTSESIDTYRRNLKILKQRLERLERKKEELEIKWGQIRAERKKNENANRTRKTNA